MQAPLPPPPPAVVVTDLSVDVGERFPAASRACTENVYVVDAVSPVA
ncbi:hypothetical protein [Krasilnikovia sp. M28-CT-15]